MLDIFECRLELDISATISLGICLKLYEYFFGEENLKSLDENKLLSLIAAIRVLLVSGKKFDLTEAMLNIFSMESLPIECVITNKPSCFNIFERGLITLLILAFVDDLDLYACDARIKSYTLLFLAFGKWPIISFS